MTDTIYIQPLGLSQSPQAEDGDAVRIAGSLVYAHRFAIIVRQGDVIVERLLVSANTMSASIAMLGGALGEDAHQQWAAITAGRPALRLGTRTIALDQPQIMGILNVTPDSFSDGGVFLDNPDNGRDHAAQMLEAGAAIIDIGGESTRPGAPATWEGDESARVIPAVEYCAAMGAAISVDTRRASVMEKALRAGAHIINDISALRYDTRSAHLLAESTAPVVLMESPGVGDNPHADSDYRNAALDVFDALRKRRDDAVHAGIAQSRIILDPGIGFGKNLHENLAILNALPMYHALGCPLLLGASRKRLIGALSHEEEPERRLGGSLALAIAGMNAGVHLLRVHDVTETVQARNVWRGMRDAALADFQNIILN